LYILSPEFTGIYPVPGIYPGDDFLDELESAFQEINALPRTWSLFQNGFRRFMLSTFPFSVIYREHDDLIYVVAVMHNSRNPGYWLYRNID